MYLPQFKLLATAVILIVTLMAGWLPFKRKAKGRPFASGEALACGVFLGAGLVHMLPAAAKHFAEIHIEYPMAFTLAGISFLFLLWLEHLGRELSAHKLAHSAMVALLAVLVLSMHSLFAGIALGVSSNMPEVTIILGAILAHKWATSFALSVQLNKSELSNRASQLLFWIFALMAPMGVILGHWVIQSHVNQPTLMAPVAISLAAGTFLYIGTLHGLNRAVMIDQCCNLREFFFVILGFTLMALVGVWV